MWSAYLGFYKENYELECIDRTIFFNFDTSKIKNSYYNIELLTRVCNDAYKYLGPHAI